MHGRFCDICMYNKTNKLSSSCNFEMKNDLFTIAIHHYLTHYFGGTHMATLNETFCLVKVKVMVDPEVKVRSHPEGHRLS